MPPFGMRLKHCGAPGMTRERLAGRFPCHEEGRNDTVDVSNIPSGIRM